MTTYHPLKPCPGCDRPIYASSRQCRGCATGHPERYRPPRSGVPAAEFRRTLDSAALLTARLGQVPQGCDRCPLPAQGIVCDPLAFGELPCELSDAEAGINPLRIPEDSWMGEVTLPHPAPPRLTPGFGKLDDDTCYDPRRRAARAKQRAAEREAA